MNLIVMVSTGILMINGNSLLNIPLVAKGFFVLGGVVFPGKDAILDAQATLLLRCVLFG